MRFDRLEHSKRFVSNPGSRFKKIYHGEVQENGDIELIFDGTEDIYRKIQAEAVGTDLPSIIARATAGDPTAFRNGTGFYGDIVDMPKTYAEVLNTVNNAQREFDKLPIEIKAKFENSFEKWFATLGTKDWYDKHGIQPVVEKTVKEDKEE